MTDKKGPAFGQVGAEACLFKAFAPDGSGNIREHSTTVAFIIDVSGTMSHFFQGFDGLEDIGVSGPTPFVYESDDGAGIPFFGNILVPLHGNLAGLRLESFHHLSACMQKGERGW